MIVSFVYNTQTYGPNPTGVDGPYNSLNIAIPDSDPVTVGTDDSTDKAFWNTSNPGWYTNTANCHGGTFCQDNNWTPNGTIAMQINAITPIVLTTPTNKNQCKGDGWKTFNNPSFKNQGQCVSFTNHN